MTSEREPDTNALFALLHDRLKGLAVRHMGGQPPQHTLQPTALLNEAYLKLCGRTASSWKDTGHFVSTASRAMRQILVDHARAKDTEKRRAPGEQVPLDDATLHFQQRADHDLEALDQRLEALRLRDPTMADFVDIHFFGGQSIEVCAAVLGIPATTLRRRWAAIKAWLRISA